MIGLGLSITQLAVRQLVGQFNPMKLFALGEQGAWYDPSDIKLDWRYNLLTRTEEFDNAVWVKFNSTVTANVVDAPDDTLTADKLVESASSGIHRVEQSIVTTASLGYSFSICVQAAERSKLRLVGVNTSGTSGGFFASFDLSSGTTGGIQSFGDGAGVSAEIQSSESEWLIATIKGSKGSATPFAFSVRLEDGSGNETYTGNGTSGIYIWGASLTTAADADKPYQKITDGVSDYFTYQPQPVLFQDAAGTTPVTAVEQPVGLMLDKSRGLVLGPELVVNGTFDTNIAGWTPRASGTTLSWVSGQLRINSGAGSFSSASQVLSLTVGRTYLVTAQISTENSATPTKISIVNNAATVVLVNSAETTSTLPTNVRLVFTATETNSRIDFYRSSASNTHAVFADNISVRELPGAHAFQTTATSRPVLSARYNLLTKTEQFDDGVWIKGPGTTVSQASPGYLITASGGDGFVFVSNTLTIGLQYKFSVTLRAGTASSIRLYSTHGEVSFVNCALNSSYQTFTLTFTPTSTAGNIQIGGGSSFPSGTVSVLNASLVPANQADLPYQRVNTATDYDAGPAFPRYLRCDGIDDWMVTGTITPGTDKAQVFAGVRKLSDATGVFLELSQDALSPVINGSFFVFNSSTTTPSGYGFYNEGTSAGIATSGANYPSPITNLLTCLGDISGDLATLRINGTQAAQSTSDQGTGNYGNYPLYLFRRGGTTLPFNGHFYGGIIRFGPNLPIETIQQTEAYMAAKTGVTLA